MILDIVQIKYMLELPMAKCSRKNYIHMEITGCAQKLTSDFCVILDINCLYVNNISFH